VSAILVTGAAGFAGSHLLEHLAGRGDLVGWARSEPPIDVAHLARWTRIDMLDGGRVREEIAALRPVEVYHCAGYANVAESWHDTTKPLAGNVMTTHHLLDGLRRAGCATRVIIPGSATVYAGSNAPHREDSPLAPSSPYAVSKLAQEQLGVKAVSEDGIDVILTRPFNHIGRRQSPKFSVSGMTRQIVAIERRELEAVIHVGRLDTARDIIDVRDTVRAYALLMERGIPGTIYNIASGIARTMRMVLDALLQRARVPVATEVDPARLRPHDDLVLVGDATRLRSETGWEPQVPFDRTLDDLFDYWRSIPALDS
jgi:GDP-4-dehydro-6-deoxy-D-mannose reductase